MSIKRLQPFFAAILMVVGTSIFLVKGRVVATYIFDAMVLTMRPSPLVPEPWDFSWGTMVFYQSGPQLGVCAVALAMSLCGALWLIPSWAAKGVAFKGWQRVALGVLGLSLLLAAGGSYLMAKGIRTEFELLAETGPLDPLTFGEFLRVPIWNAARICLCIAALCYAMLTLSAKRGEEARSSATDGAKPNRVILTIACAGGTYFFGLLLVLCFGPATHLIRLAQPEAEGDPETYATLIKTGVDLLSYSSIGLLLAGGAALVASFRHLD